jgi:hypothetical protein
MGTTVVELQSRVFEYSHHSVGVKRTMKGTWRPFPAGKKLADVILQHTLGFLIHLCHAGKKPTIF